RGKEPTEKWWGGRRARPTAPDWGPAAAPARLARIQEPVWQGPAAPTGRKPPPAGAPERLPGAASSCRNSPLLMNSLTRMAEIGSNAGAGSVTNGSDTPTFDTGALVLENLLDAHPEHPRELEGEG